MAHTSFSFCGARCEGSRPCQDHAFMNDDTSDPANPAPTALAARQHASFSLYGAECQSQREFVRAPARQQVSLHVPQVATCSQTRSQGHFSILNQHETSETERSVLANVKRRQVGKGAMSYEFEAKCMQMFLHTSCAITFQTGSFAIAHCLNDTQL